MKISLFAVVSVTKTTNFKGKEDAKGFNLFMWKSFFALVSLVWLYFLLYGDKEDAKDWYALVNIGLILTERSWGN